MRTKLLTQLAWYSGSTLNAFVPCAFINFQCAAYTPTCTDLLRKLIRGNSHEGRCLFLFSSAAEEGRTVGCCFWLKERWPETVVRTVTTDVSAGRSTERVHKLCWLTTMWACGGPTIFFDGAWFLGEWEWEGGRRKALRLSSSCQRRLAAPRANERIRFKRSKCAQEKRGANRRHEIVYFLLTYVSTWHSRLSKLYQTLGFISVAEKWIGRHTRTLITEPQNTCVSRWNCPLQQITPKMTSMTLNKTSVGLCTVVHYAGR